MTSVFLLLLTAAALLVHGYHPYAEDAEIYLPGVEHLLNSTLFPAGQEFFQSHAHMTLFPNVVAFSLRLSHMPLEAGLFAWHLVSIFLLLLAAWELGGVLFSTSRAQWGAVCMVAALLTIPVAGTALFLMDQYLNPRNLAAFASVFAVTRTLQKKYGRAVAWLALAASVHPLMWVFPCSFLILWLVIERFDRRASVSGNGYETSQHGSTHEWSAPDVGACLIASTFVLPRASYAYHEAARRHAYFYIQHWRWFEWLGIIVPLLLLVFMGRIARTQQRHLLARACRAFTTYGVIYVIVAVAIDLPPQFESLARMQPLRSLHLLYAFLLVCLGGFASEYVLKKHTWRWLALFLPLCLGMFAAQRSLFPESMHVEWPGSRARNLWLQAFVWIRQHTPADAVFALDPDYMRIAGEDALGFRCSAQRSRLADAVKDGGVVSMFPPLADMWWEQVKAQSPWKNFQAAADFGRLQKKYGVSWVVVQQPGVAGLECAYENSAVRVCRLP